ncbi:hypothetical protein GOODEAATRI_016713 [Goodea atripinnis]|uniref:Transmembrane prolyl 4-hydroxylase n=1 Tax=Goodea atripinnis TaxID=208336 RepID=A0ABV0NXR3_9TELE
MTDNQENTDAEDASPSGSPTSPPRPPSDRLPCHKSSVCSRSYFVLVMVFFHVYIINVIALLFYVHYSSGQEDASRSSDAPSGGQHQRSEPRRPPPSKPDFIRDVSLTRVEGIRVGHVQQVALVPGKVHEMRTLSLKPLLFGEENKYPWDLLKAKHYWVTFLLHRLDWHPIPEIPGFLSEDECRVVMQLAQLKGLMESQLMVQEGQEELAKELDLSPEEIFNLLDINRDGQLQLHEVYVLTHSRVRDGIWLTPENLREIYDGLKADKNGDGVPPTKQRCLSALPAAARGEKESTGSEQPAHLAVSGQRSTSGPPENQGEVVRYEKGGHYHAHHDSGPVYPETACTHTRLAANISTPFETSCRYITVLFYLNSVDGGGETAFPVADNRTYDEVVGKCVRRQLLKVYRVHGFHICANSHVSLTNIDPNCYKHLGN